MRKRKKNGQLMAIILLLILSIGIGYAFIRTDLTITGIGKFNSSNWNVFFDNLRVTNGSVTLSTGDSAATIDQTTKTEVTYTVTLNQPGDFYEFLVDVKNTGSMDAMVGLVSNKYNGTEISSTNPLPEYLEYSVTYDNDMPILLNHQLNHNSTETYKVRIEFKKDFNVSLLPSTPQSKTFSFGVSYIQADSNKTAKQSQPTIKASSVSDRSAFRSDTYRENIKTLTFNDTISPPSNVIESWDIGVDENGNVMAYITANSTDNTKYDLYIQGDGKLYANPDSEFLFSELKGLDSINNIDKLNTSKAVNMAYMFYYTGYNSTSFTLDLGNNFDTSNVTNMYWMFYNTGYSSTTFTLNLGDKFDTSKVTNMLAMFLNAGHSSNSFTLDLGNKFDTSNVENMEYMFYETGYTNQSFTLNLGNKFDTSKVTSMSQMFFKTGYNSTIMKLDLGSKFNTSKVTNFSYMFYQTGYSSLVFTLNLGDRFKTSSANTMYWMFYGVGHNSPVFTLELGNKFDTSNVTAMQAMFLEVGYSNPNFKLKLNKKFSLASSPDITYMFTNMGAANPNKELDLSMLDFSNYTSTDDFAATFSGLNANSKVYVKDQADQNIIIQYGGNGYLTTNNVLIKGM